jgi:heparan-alpha-glucosaminide N-acetyltransferase
MPQALTESDSTSETTRAGTTHQAKSSRLSSIDAYRGFVMFLMMAEMIRLSSLANIFPEHQWLQWLKFHTTHVEWTGCSLHDLIQPSFSFLVGTSLAFSLLNRSQQQSMLQILGHAAWRSSILIYLGIFLRSLHREQTNFTFEDTLTQIGLGYFPLVAVALARPYITHIMLGLLLVGYWALFAFFPLPAANFDTASVGVPADWPHQLQNFEAHWNKNTNAAWAFDRQWLNYFPRTEVFEFNRGGYATLSFIPTLATMLLGLIAGRWLSDSQLSTRNRLIYLAIAASATLALGWGLAALGVCPIVKRIWTPTWTLWSGGCCFALMALFYLLLDVAKTKYVFFPLLVIGTNSIASYVMAETLPEWIGENLIKHFGTAPFLAAGEDMQPISLGATTFAVLWLILLWMYRQRFFVKI